MLLAYFIRLDNFVTSCKLGHVLVDKNVTRYFKIGNILIIDYLKLGWLEGSTLQTVASGSPLIGF